MNWIRGLFKNKRSDAASNSVPAGSASQVKATISGIAADNPITKPEDDALGRANPARSFADQILSLNASEGVVVGVLGPWGSGKTSFVNLAQRRLKESGITVLEFNPWMFSGADQLVQAFFVELSAQLKLRPDLEKIGNLVEDYGEAFSGLGWLPLVGPWIERGRAATKMLATLLQRRKEGIRGRQAKVRSALAELTKPIVVILDDLDRLSTPEIRDVFKLVRLTANFPNIVYLLAFDRIRVEQALDEQGVPGRDYLEKILQVGIDLPAVPDNALNSQIFKATDTALAEVENPGNFDSDAWPDVFMEIIRPLIRNMRDVRRYAAAIHGATRELNGQVALVDLLALEAVRVFLPDVFRSLHSVIDGLTSTREGYGGRGDSPHLKKQIDSLIEAGGSRGQIVHRLIERLFPAAQHHIGGPQYGSDWKKSWLRERRVAHEDILRFYLERVMGEGLLAFADAENVWSKMTDRLALESYFYSIPIERIEDVISAIEAYEDQFKPEHVVPTTVALLNLLPTLPERNRGMFDLGPRLVVGRVVYRLVRSLKNPEAVERAVREALPQISSLSSKLELITDVGYREGSGHKLVSEEAAKSLEREWRALVRATTPESLARETELLRTLILTKRDAEPDEPVLLIPNTLDITHALLEGSRSEVRSQSMGSRAVRRKPRLAWDTLIELYGDEAALRQRIEALKNSELKNSGDLLELAEKYLAGWRPKEFDDD